ncbi:MAG: 4Fe-4S dicluster domain-containing protein [Anaerolineaceae bacterium]|nr:4Fe-4S dicluster domain-containing protein [Anaerolineaceae bacterium]
MPDPNARFPSWLIEWMQTQKIDLWGVADLGRFSTPADVTGKGFPQAISWAVPMDHQIMSSIQGGPNQIYADEYARVNSLINHLSASLADEICKRDFRALSLAASERTDPINIKGDFPHKTAATRAGLGWIGRNCQLITRPFGPWVRLGTVFTDMPLPNAQPVEKSSCGGCTKCVDACPAKALKGGKWHPGIPRKEILNALACDLWKKAHYFQFHEGHNCGICAAVCPFGLKVLKEHAN